MSLETATYLTQLNASNPPEGDPAEQGADHLRLLKSVLQATLPNLNAPVTASPKNLNSDTVPVGGIIMWSGSVANLPPTWALCTGQTATLADGSGNTIVTPNLQDLFIVGAGNTYTVGATGGAASNTPTIGGTALTQAQMPSHSHGVNDPGHNHGVNDPGHAHGTQPYNIPSGPNSYNGGYSGASNTASGTYAATTGIYLSPSGTGISIQNAGSGATHTHSCSVVPTLPPYYALAFIMKL